MYVQQRAPINSICQELETSYTTVRAILDSNKIPVRGRGTYTLRGADHPSSKLSSDDLQALETALLGGEEHGPLAAKFGISRERVRQIANGVGAPTGRQLQMMRRLKKQKEKDALRQKRQEAREQDRYERYRPWRDLWAQGYSVKRIAASLCLQPGAVSVRIVNLRKDYPDWFPKRRGVSGEEV